MPFTQELNGNLVVHGLPFNVQVADGTPDAPGGAMIFGIATRPIQVQRAVVNMSVTHESIGDLLGNLSHNGRFAVLNNHFLPSGAPPLNNRYSFTYDDSNQGDNLASSRPGQVMARAVSMISLERTVPVPGSSPWWIIRPRVSGGSSRST